MLARANFGALEKTSATPPLNLSSIYLTHIHNKKGERKSVKEKLLFGKSTINESLKLQNGQELMFEISPQAFFQPNTFQAQTLYEKALEAAAIKENEIVFDLFCGAGTIGIFCAQKAKKVYGIEINESALENARKNAKKNKIKNIEFLVGDVGKNLPDIAEKPNVIIVDPPRNGIEIKTLEKIMELNADRIVYVSCNPTTLARDCRLLKNYVLKRVQPVDMFPHTYHIECVAILKKM